MVDFIFMTFFVIERLDSGILGLRILTIFGCIERVVNWGLIGGREEFEEFLPVDLSTLL